MTTSNAATDTAHDPLVSIPPIGNLSSRRDSGPEGTPSLLGSQMLELARRWAPYGGVETGQALVEFGLDRPQFYARVQLIREELEG